MANGVNALKSNGATTISVDGCDYPDAAAEAATMTLWAYDEMKSERETQPTVELLQ